ncbi:cystatin-B-like [Hemitrygon akajei]|uniref:cystatin-B-like n=1 Tax=Hemitrygon akajei TaxID=2704970 RepID=UPI003BFA30E4
MAAKGVCCGGISEGKPVTQEVQQLADSVKSQVEDKAGKTFDVFVVKAYKTQLVSGTNHYLKIHVGGIDYIHVKVYEKLPCHGSTKEILSIQDNKSKDEEINFF